MSFKFVAPMLILAVAVLAGIPNPAPGCAIAPLKGQSGTSVQTTSEQAAIFYDEATQTEHFIRSASFSGSSADFGFLVPTPSKPEIAEADGSLFHDLADVTKPKVQIQKKYVSNFGNIGCSDAKSTFSNVGDAFPMAAKPDVSVVEQKRVGNLDYAILQAETPQALRDWFVKNGYDDRPELTEWLKPYIAMKWFISAYKMATDATGPNVTTSSGPNAPVRTFALTGTTVRMSFKTDRPFYPYREPSDAQKMVSPGGRLLRVYMLASTISTGLIGFENGTTWPGRTVWAGQAPFDAMPTILKKAKLDGESASKKAWFLTEFEDRASPRPGTDEIYFGPAPSQSPVERPPIIQYEYIDTTRQDAATFFGIVFVVVLAMAFGAVAIFKRIAKTE